MDDLKRKLMSKEDMSSPARVSPLAGPAPFALRAGFWVCIVIAVAVVVRRLFALAGPPRAASPQLAALDLAFANHSVLTLCHILPALAFAILAPIVIFRKTERLAWADRLLFPIGAIVGLTAYAMSLYSIGGWIERSAVLFFDTLFLFSLAQAYRFHSARDLVRKREWLVRSIGILLGIATTRPVMGVFFATSPLTHLEPNQFFGMAFWIGFSINTLVVELWLRTRKTRPLAG
jgi:Predicted membrane protein (DUF2306)